MTILSNRARIAGLAAALAAVTLLAAPGFARADAVRDWNLNATTALAAQDARVAVLHLAMVHGAVFDAVNAIDRGYRPYLVSPRAKPWDSPDAAAATAAYRVLVGIVPEQKPALEALYASSLAAIPDGPMKAGGIHAGETAAAAMIAERTNDGRFGSPGLPTGTMPGQWRPVLPMFVNDPSGWIRNVTPFLIKDASQFRSHGPFPLTSRRYAADFAEVKAIGSATSTTRTADQTSAARYWAENPPATWTRIARMLSLRAGAVGGRQRPLLRDAVPDPGRRTHQRLGRQGAMVVLATDHGDPRGGDRREREDGGGSRVAASDPDSALPRAPVRSPRPQRLHRADAAAVLRDGRHRLE